MIGAEAYIDATKDTWRGWKWNRIADLAVGKRRVPPSERARILGQKVVLYLVGPEDHDRRKALSLGFANHNLIAVDVVEQRVRESRKIGGFAIRGVLQQVLMEWPRSWRVDVIDADFCCGMTEDTLHLPKVLLASRAIHRDTVISLNMLRGRDAASNIVRGAIRALKHIPKRLADELATHRGSAWLAWLATLMTATIGVGAEELKPYWQASLNEYKSKTSGQWFDSVVHRWGIEPDSANWTNDFLEQLKGVVSSHLSDRCGQDGSLRGRIAALRAVRTKKLLASHLTSVHRSGIVPV